MANILDAAMPRILAQGLKTLREQSVMAMLVNRSFDSEAKQKGSSVDVPIPSNMGIADDVIPGPVHTASVDLSPAFVPIKLDKWKEAKFHLTDKDIGEVMAGIYNLQVMEAARSLANAVDADLMKLYKSVGNVAGVAGQIPFQKDEGATAIYKGLGAATEARKVLNKSLAPMTDRRIILSVDAEANASALPQFLAANEAGTDITIRQGRIGEKLGFDWYMSQNIVSHDAMAAGTVVTSGAANLKGVKTITVSGATVAPVKGDVFSIAGGGYYSVGDNPTATSWSIVPALRADVAAATAITVVADHEVNLAFHRDAFALAVRPLLDVDPVGNRIESFTDDVSGLTMRLEVSRQNKQTQFSFDILYGCAAIRPETACRILG